MSDTVVQNSELIDKDPIESGSFFDQVRKYGAKRILEAQDSTSKLGVDAHLNAFDMDSFIELLQITNKLETYQKTRDQLKGELSNIIES